MTYIQALCPYCNRNDVKAICIARCLVVSLKFVYSESIKQWILSIHFIHFDCYFALTRIKMWLTPITSSKISNLIYFISNIFLYFVTQRLKDYESNPVGSTVVTELSL